MLYLAATANRLVMRHGPTWSGKSDCLEARVRQERDRRRYGTKHLRPPPTCPTVALGELASDQPQTGEDPCLVGVVQGAGGSGDQADRALLDANLMGRTIRTSATSAKRRSPGDAGAP